MEMSSEGMRDGRVALGVRPTVYAVPSRLSMQNTLVEHAHWVLLGVGL